MNMNLLGVCFYAKKKIPPEQEDLFLINIKPLSAHKRKEPQQEN